MVMKTCIVFCISFALILPAVSQQKPGKRNERQAKALSAHIGEKFQLDNIVDSTGKAAALDLSRSDLTIIDLWFNTCAPCIAEMTEFAKMLLGKEMEITVISISINNFPLWKKTLDEHSGRFSFLAAGLQNWKHYNLLSAQEVKQQVPTDRLDELREKYDVQFFPAYFVLDKNGIIQSRPPSAVKFISEYK
jgi:hypothetical protein